MQEKVVLIILDGWGLSPSWRGNAILASNPPNFNKLWREYGHTILNTNNVRDSKLAHEIIGAGRPILSLEESIEQQIADKTIFKNKKLINFFNKNFDSNSTIHLVGQLTLANQNLALTLIKIAQRCNFKNLQFDFLLDTNDDRSSNLQILNEIGQKLKQTNSGYISSLTNKKIAFGNFNEEKKIFRMLFDGKAEFISSFQKALSPNQFSDLIILSGFSKIKNNDSILFISQLDELEKIFRGKVDCLNLTEIFTKPEINDNLCDIFEQYQKDNLRLTDEFKIEHITTSFNSDKKNLQFTYCEIIHARSGFSSNKITQSAVKAINSNKYDFILINFSDADILAHTSSINNVNRAVLEIDRALEKVSQCALNEDYNLIICADHGHIEEMNGHSINPVPFILVSKKYKKNLFGSALSSPSNSLAKIVASKKDLTCIAPTILQIMRLPKPNAMTGQSLINFLE